MVVSVQPRSQSISSCAYLHLTLSLNAGEALDKKNILSKTRKAFDSRLPGIEKAGRRNILHIPLHTTVSCAGGAQSASSIEYTLKKGTECIKSSVWGLYYHLSTSPQIKWWRLKPVLNSLISLVTWVPSPLAQYCYVSSLEGEGPAEYNHPLLYFNRADYEAYNTQRRWRTSPINESVRALGPDRFIGLPI